MAEATVWTVNKILQWTQQYFAGKGLESPRLDAEVLLCDVLGCRRIDLFMRLQQELTEEELHTYHDLVVRRAAWEPLAYITGRKTFLQWDFKVTPAVLIPRPETELLVEKLIHCLTGKSLTQLSKALFWQKKAQEAKIAAEKAKQVSLAKLQEETDPEKAAVWQQEVVDREAVAAQTAERAGWPVKEPEQEATAAESFDNGGAPANDGTAGNCRAATTELLPTPSAAGKEVTILDIGTGSGAILCSLLALLPEARGLGVDLSLAALEMAKENAQALRVGERAWFLRSDLWAKVPPAAQFDVVVSNPPYIPSADIETLAADVQREPRLALDGGADGLAAYRRIAEKLADHVKPDGIAAFEVGIGQGKAVAALCAAQGLTITAVVNDYAGIDRMVFAARSESAKAEWIKNLQ